MNYYCFEDALHSTQHTRTCTHRAPIWRGLINLSAFVANGARMLYSRDCPGGALQLLCSAAPISSSQHGLRMFRLMEHGQEGWGQWVL